MMRYYVIIKQDDGSWYGKELHDESPTYTLKQAEKHAAFLRIIGGFTVRVVPEKDVKKWRAEHAQRGSVRQRQRDWIDVSESSRQD